MTRMQIYEPRDVAEAISYGLNCVAAIAALADESGSSTMPRTPNPEWPETLQAMQRALEAVARKTVTTDLVVTEDDIERVRRIQASISDWMAKGRPSAGLNALTEEIIQWFSQQPSTTGV